MGLDSFKMAAGG